MAYPQVILDIQTRRNAAQGQARTTLNNQLQAAKLDYFKQTKFFDQRSIVDAINAPRTLADKQAVYAVNFGPSIQASIDKWKVGKDPLLVKTVQNFFSNPENIEAIFESMRTQYTAARATAAAMAGTSQAGRVTSELLNPQGSDILIRLAPLQDFLKKATNNEIRTLSALEAELATGSAKGRQALLNSLSLSTGVDPNAEEPDISTLLNIRQCMLMTDLLHGGQSETTYPKSWLGSAGANPGRQPFYGRILPVKKDNFDPEALMNLLTISKKAKPYFGNGIGNEGTSLRYKLVWVFMNANGELKEAEIFLDHTSMLQSQTSFADETFMNASFETANASSGIVSDNNSGLGYKFTNIDVTFEGTNPSTARDDVQATFTIEMDHIGCLETICAAAIVDSQLGPVLPSTEIKYVTLIDLVSLPHEKGSMETSVINGSNKVLKSQYSPDYSRLRLKVYTDTEQEDCLIVDLATIDHEISRSEDTSGTITYTINYRGYFEQSLNMPFNDAFTSPEVVQARKDNEDLLDNLQREECDPALIRKVIKSNSDYIRLTGEQFANDGGFIKKIMDSGKMFDYKIVTGTEKLHTSAGGVDPSINYVDSITPSAAFVYSQLQGTTAEEMTNAAYWGIASETLTLGVGDTIYNWFADKPLGSIDYGAGEREAANSLNFNKCFFLGDLMNACLDCLYQANTGQHIAGLEHLRLKFIVGSVDVPNPLYFSTNNTATKSTIRINPLQIPIDLGFFISWYHDNYVKKGIFSYPVGTFIRDLVEKLVNNLLFDICFAILLPDEQPASLRTAFYSDHNSGEGAFKNVGDGDDPWWNPYDPFGTSPSSAISVRDPNMNVLMRRKATDSIEMAYNYCIIYPSSPSYFRQLRAQKTTKLSDDESTVTMYYGANIKDGNYCSNVTFTKTTSPFLREARYNGSSFGSLSLMSNVYDLDFEFDKVKANTYLFPGNMINFILTEFAGAAHWDQDTDLFESNPHKAGTKANILGFGGYYIIKSVKYTLKPSDGLSFFNIKISTKFAGTDAEQTHDGNRTNKSNKFADEKDECIAFANKSIAKINQLNIGMEKDTLESYVFNNGSPASGGNTPGTQPATQQATQQVTPLIIAQQNLGNNAPSTVIAYAKINIEEDDFSEFDASDLGVQLNKMGGISTVQRVNSGTKNYFTFKDANGNEIYDRLEDPR